MQWPNAARPPLACVERSTHSRAAGRLRSWAVGGVCVCVCVCVCVLCSAQGWVCVFAITHVSLLGDACLCQCALNVVCLCQCACMSCLCKAVLTADFFFCFGGCTYGNCASSPAYWAHASRAHTYTHTYTHKHTHTYTYIHTHITTNTHSHTRTHIRKHTHVRTHAHTHTHTHAHIRSL